MSSEPMATAAPVAVHPPLSLYIHIPWCVRKCPYCDFNSHALRDPGVPEAAYLTALLEDLERGDARPDTALTAYLRVIDHAPEAVLKALRRAPG